jgi:hypothetical protein
VDVKKTIFYAGMTREHWERKSRVLKQQLRIASRNVSRRCKTCLEAGGHT